MKAFALTFFILCSGCIFAESVNLNCEFRYEYWDVLGNVDTCQAHNQGDIITDISNRDVTTINGSTNSNPSVKGVFIKNSNCFYFPHGLQKIFTDLQGIAIYNSKLREVRRDNLKEYTNLRELELPNSEIKFLESNLFEFTPKLEVIRLESNKIAYIDANVFNNFLGKLRYLRLSGNICQFENAENDKSKANEIIEKVQSGSCQDISTLTTAQLDALTKLIGNLQVSLMQEVKTLRDEVNGNLAALKDKFDTSEASFKSQIQNLSEQIKNQEIKIKDELKKDIKEVKDKLEFNQNETKSSIKEVKDQNLDIKAGLGNITQFEKRIKLIENTVGVDPEHYNQP